MVFVSVLDRTYDYVEQSLHAYRLTWKALKNGFGVDQVVVPTMYLTQTQDTILAAIDRDVEHPGWLAGFADLSTDETFVMALDPFTFHTIAHEVAHLGIRLGVDWINEGLAEYVGFQVGFQMDPDQEYLGRLGRRYPVRRAVASGTAHTVDDLLSWRWATASVEDTDLFYAQSWWFTAYLVSTFGEQAMRDFIQGVGRRVSSNAFRDSFGIEAEAALDNFLATVLVNPWPEERIADSVLRFDGVRAEHSTLTQQWNALIAVSDPADPKSEAWLRLGSQYASLSQQTRYLEVEEALVVVRDKYSEAYGLLSEAADHLAENTETGRGAATRPIVIANALVSEAYDLLADLAAQYPWGVQASGS